MKPFRSLRLLWLCVPAFLLMTGCGSAEKPKYKVTGQLTLDGKPLTLASQPPLGQVKVQFLAAGGEPGKLVDPNDAIYDLNTGKFTINGLEGKGIEAGKYRVAVYQYDPYPQVDKLKGKFSKESTPITVEVTSTVHDFPIELSQYK